MKTEFLQNLKVGDQPLSKEVIDAILAENGRDIEAAKKPFADYDHIKQQLDEAQKTIKGFQDQDIDGIRKSAKDWEDKYNQAVKDHEAKLADMAFDRKIEEAITVAKGRSVKAILGELGTEKVAELRNSKNQDADIKAAMDALQKDSGYLFGDVQTPPPYSGGTGTGAYQGGQDSSATLRAAMGLPAAKTN